MKNFTDLVPTTSNYLYRYEVVNPDGTGTGQYMYLKYAPGELVLNPTPINRASMMAIQGFISSDTTFNADGSITDTNADGDTLTTVFNADGSITATFVSGTQSFSKTTTFNADGSITETIA